MPDFPLPEDLTRITEKSVSLQFVDHRGKKRSAAIKVGAATNAQIDGMRVAVASASNAGLASVSIQSVDRVPSVTDPNFKTFDEAYSSNDHVAVFVFQNSQGDIKTVEIPAPDLSIFSESDGETVDRLNALAASVITNVTTVLNSDGAGGTSDNYTYARGFLSTRASSRTRKRSIPTIAEPGAGDTPGQAPGNNP